MKELSPVPPDALAVEARDLRKEFVRKDRKRGKRRVAGARGRLARARAWRVRRDPRPERLGEVDARPPALDPAPAGRRRARRVFGYDVVRDGKAVRRLVNRVSVEASFFKKMSPSENLHYAARFYGMTLSETTEQIPLILGRVGFPPDRRGEPMENLSRGMQQKVALARALLTSPVLLLLDEPTTGLDPRSKLEVQDFIREMRAVHDSTILLCTHDLDEAESLAERVGILDRGRLLALEPADELKAALRRRDARGGVLRRDRPRLRGRGGRARRRGEEGARMRAVALSLRHELIGLAGVVERNVYLTRRYIYWDVAFFVWTVANTLTIVFIAEGIEATGGQIDVERVDDDAADRRRRLGVPRDHLRVPHRDGRLGALGGDDRVHVHGAALAGDAPRRLGRLRRALRARPRDPAVRRRRGVLRARSSRTRTSSPRSSILVVASISFFGIGMMTAVLPLISPEKGAQLGFVAQGMLLVVSGVYYPVEVLPAVDAVAREDLAGDLRARRDPRVDPRRRLARARCGTTSGRCS